MGSPAQEVYLLRIRVLLRSETVLLILRKLHRKPSWFAGQVGITPEYFYEMLAGRKNISEEMTKKIQGRLRGYDWDSLFVIKNLNEL